MIQLELSEWLIVKATINVRMLNSWQGHAEGSSMFAALPFPPDPREVEVAPQSRLPSKLCPKLSCRHHPLQALVKGRSGIVTGLSFYPHSFWFCVIVWPQVQLLIREDHSLTYLTLKPTLSSSYLRVKGFFRGQGST